MISAQSLEQLKQVIDIVEVVQGYIELKRAGINYQAICPFHNEKTPSFIVNPQKNSFRCYGCSKSGNAITFVMEYEKLDFVGAVQKLADKFRVPLEYTHKTQQNTQEWDLLELITRFYQDQLASNPTAQEYLQKRGVSPSSVQEFRLGFCHPRALEDFITKYHLDRSMLIQLGVLAQYGGKSYARFANRLIFPIHNPNGKIVGFGGRILDTLDTTKVAKYINSPQTPLFNKSKLLYGYFLAREAILKQKQILVTEGYLDVILLHQAGIKHAVATLGTALSEQHLPILNRGMPSVIMGYDGDRAGHSAALKASQLLAKELKSGGVVVFENNLDPAEMVASGQIKRLQECLAQPMKFIEFVLRGIREQHDLNDPLQKEQALKEAQNFLHDLPLVVQEDYRQMTAHLLEIPQSGLIGLKKQKPPAPSPSGERAILDPLEEVLIKYMALDHALIQNALDFVQVESFRHCQEEFKALCAGQFDQARLVAIMLDDRLPIEPHGFKDNLVKLIKRHCEWQITQIHTLYTHLDLSERIAMMNEWKKKRYLCEQGELVKIWKP